MSTYKLIVIALVALVIGFAWGTFRQSNKNHETNEDYKIVIENLYHAHVNDSMWNGMLQDSLDKRIIRIDTVLVPTIKHHYHEVYRNIDSASGDSISKLLPDLIDRHAEPKGY